jgi:hypothetical protein
MINLIIQLLKKYWYWAALIGASVTIYLLSNDIKAKKAEINRKTSNIEVLNKDFISYVASVKVVLNNKDTTIKLQAAKVGSLTYTLDEFKRYRAGDAQTIKLMGLKFKNVLSVANVSTQTSQNITTQTIKTDSSMCFAYKDSFIQVAGCAYKDKTILYYSGQDSLTIIPSVIPKHKFLWMTWGVKGVQLDVISKNPNTTFTYAKYVEIKR